jgi:hypothetical protein
MCRRVSPKLGRPPLGSCESEAVREAAIAVTSILRRLPNVDERVPEIKTPEAVSPCGRPDNEHGVLASACSALDWPLKGAQSSCLTLRSRPADPANCPCERLPLRTVPVSRRPFDQVFADVRVLHRQGGRFAGRHPAQPTGAYTEQTDGKQVEGGRPVDSWA